MENSEKSITDITSELRILAIKLQGIAEIFGMAQGEPPFSEDALHGLSEIFMGFALDLGKIREVLEYDLKSNFLG